MTRKKVSRKSTPPSTADELFAILEELTRAMAVIKTANRSLEHREDDTQDEVITLDAAMEKLRRVDVALNAVADGRPSQLEGAR